MSSILVEIKKFFTASYIFLAILAASMRLVVSFFLVSTSLLGHGQYLDLAKLEYTYAPGNNSNFTIESTRFLFNAPIKIKEGAYLFAGIDYTNINFEFREDEDSYEKSDASEFHEMDFNFTYTFQIGKDWRLGAQVTPSFSSNLDNGLEREDFLFTSVLALVKDKKDAMPGKKPWRLIVGLAYSSISRQPIPVPFMSYYRKFHPRWSYNVGAPVSNIQFHLNAKNRFKLYIEGDGFNSRIQNGVVVNNADPANRVRMLLVMAGIRYEYKFSENIESYINVTRTIFADFQLRQNLENIFEPSIDNMMHYRIGIRYRI